MDEQEVQVAPVEQEQATEIPAQAPESVTTALTDSGSTDVPPPAVEAVTAAPTKPKRIPQGTGTPLSFGDEPMGIELSFAEEAKSWFVTRDPVRKSDLVITAMSILKEEGIQEPRTEAEEEQLIQMASDRVKQKRDALVQAQADQKILESTNVEETLDAVQELQQRLNKPVLLSEIRADEIQQAYPTDSPDALYAADSIAANMRSAQFVSQAQQQLWDQTGWFDIVLDALEIVVPGTSVTFIASEARAKQELGGGSSLWNYIDRGGSYEDLAQKLSDVPMEKRGAVVDSMIQQIITNETLLIGNSNSLLQADQLDLLEKTLRDGFAAYLGGGAFDTGSLISGETGERVFSAVDLLTLGIYGGAKRLGKGVFRKLFPPDNARSFAGSRADTGSGFDNRNAVDPMGTRVAANATGSPIRSVVQQGIPNFSAAQRFIPVNETIERVMPVISYRGKEVPVEELQRVVDQLDLRATGKMTRKARKDLDQERKAVGERIAYLESKAGVNEAAAPFVEQGLSRKNAIRKGKQAQQEELNALRTEREYLNSVIRQSDDYARAEAEASRIRQALDNAEVKYVARSSVARLNLAPAKQSPSSGAAIDDSLKGIEEAVNPLVKADELSIVNAFNKAVDEAAVGLDDAAKDLEFTAFDPARIEDSIRDMGLAQQIDPARYGEVVDQAAYQITRSTGGSLKHVPGNTTWKPNSQSDSLGDFKVYFGNGDTGFDTIEEASMAGKMGIGEDLRPVQINGRWYLEKTFTHKYNPSTEAGYLDVSRISSVNPLFGWFLNPLRKLSQVNLRDVWGNIEANRSMAASVLKPAQKALNSLSAQELGDVSKLLSKGDEMQVVFQREEVQEALGKLLSDKAYDAYLKTRAVFDMHYEVLNNSTRKVMERKGFKSMHTDDPNDSFFGELIRLDDISDEMRVLDTSTGKAIRKADIPEDAVIMRTVGRKTTDEGSFTIVVGKPEKVGPLPQQVVNKRVGHVTRMYQDRQFKVVESFKRVVNGVEIDDVRTLGITRLESESGDLLKALRSNPKYANSTLEVRKTVENPEQSVEGFFDDMKSMGYTSSNARTRGEQLLAADMSPARIADPIESMALAQFRIERELNMDVVKTLQQRFMNSFSEYLLHPTALDKALDAFPREPAFLKFKEGTPTSVKNQIENAYNYIYTMDGIRKGKIAEYFNSAMRAVEETLYRGTGLQLNKALQKVVDGDAQRAFMRLATNAFIIGRPLFQIPTNLLQTLNIMMRYPALGTRAAARAIGVASALAARGSDDFAGMWKALGKTGYSDEQLNQLLDLIDETGIVRTTGTVDDFLGAVSDGINQLEKPSGALKRLGQASVRAGTFIPRKALDASSKLQEASLNYVNLVAIIAEFDSAIERGVKLTARNKSEILIRARGLTQTQNSLDQFGYQNGHNPLQMMFQFVQHVNKLFLDIAVEPALKAATGRGIVKGNEGAFAESRRVAATVALLTVSLFGVNGLPVGSDVGGKATNYLREMYINSYGEDLPDELWQLFQGGLINALINSSIDGNVDVTARISPSAFVDMVVQMFDNMSLDIFGAAGGITGSVLDIGHAVKVLATTPELDTMDKGLAILRETANFFSGMKDMERAQIASTWLTQPYNSSLSGNMRVTHDEALFNLFSVNSKMIEDVYRDADFSGRKKSTLEQTTNIMIRQMNRELTALKAAGSLDYFKTVEVTEKWIKYAKAHVSEGQYDEVRKQFRMFMIQENGEGFRNFIKDYIDGQSTEQQIRSLKRLRNEVQFSDYKQQIDHMLWFMGEK